MKSDAILNSIGYKGTITVTVKKGKKTISKKTYHNSGGLPLFEFLCKCIASNTHPTRYAPRFIKLFSFDDSYVADAKVDMSIDATYSKNASVAVAYNSAEQLTINDIPVAYLHFTIPYSALDNSDTASATFSIYQAGLYNSYHTSVGDETNYSAAFNFVNDLNEWDPIIINPVTGDYNIFIDWTMSFTNQATTEDSTTTTSTTSE